MADDGILDRVGQEKPWMWLVLAAVFAGFVYIEVGIVRYANVVLLLVCLAFAGVSYRKRRD